MTAERNVHITTLFYGCCRGESLLLNRISNQTAIANKNSPATLDRFHYEWGQWISAREKRVSGGILCDYVVGHIFSLIAHHTTSYTPSSCPRFFYVSVCVRIFVHIRAPSRSLSSIDEILPVRCSIVFCPHHNITPMSFTGVQLVASRGRSSS